MPIHVLLKKSLREYNKIEMMREISVLYFNLRKFCFYILFIKEN